MLGGDPLGGLGHLPAPAAAPRQRRPPQVGTAGVRYTVAHTGLWGCSTFAPLLHFQPAFFSALSCPKLACSCVHRCPADCAATASGAAAQRLPRRGDANHGPLRRLQHWLWRYGGSHRAAAAGAATRRPGGLPLVGGAAPESQSTDAVRRAVLAASQLPCCLVSWLCVLFCSACCACRYHLGCLPASSWHEARARGVVNLRNVSGRLGAAEAATVAQADACSPLHCLLCFEK